MLAMMKNPAAGRDTSNPASLRGSAQISIRLQSKSGYFSYNWFYNVTTR